MKLGTLRSLPISMLLGEVRTAREAVRLSLRTPSLLKAPRGRGEPVMLMPGFGTDDKVLLPLRVFLRSKGYAATGWGLGTNDGDVERLMADATTRIEERAEHDGPLALVGWSLGGVVAREVARDRPDLVTRVVTFGTPLWGPRGTVPNKLFDPATTAHIEAEIEVRNTRPIEVPVTAIHSKRDGVVDWRDSIDEITPGAENLEVSSSHTGMGIDPDVWSILIDRLAASRNDPATKR